MTAKIVERAALTPGVCFISGDFNGPFIDTDVNIRGRGRVYIALKHLAPLLREAGWIPEGEAAEDRARAENHLRDVSDLTERAELGDALVEALRPVFPLAAPVIRQVAVPDPEVVREVAVLRGKVAQLKASLSELTAVSEAVTTTPDAAPPAQDDEGSVDTEPGETATTEVAGQSVDLDALLGRKVGDIVAVAEGWPAEALEALVAREILRAEKAKVPARKTVLGLLDPEPEPETGGEA